MTKNVASLKEKWTSAQSLVSEPRERFVQRALTLTAQDSIKGLAKGVRIVGLTGGQFSLLGLIRAILDVTGPADLLLSTWTAGIRDAETAAWLLAGGQIRSLRILTDRSFPQRQPGYCQRLVELFGEQCLALTHTHAKFAVIENDEWAVCVRSSMNLNKNKRWEQFDLDEDPEMCAFFREFSEQVVSEGVVGMLGVPNEEVEEGFQRVLAEERRLRHATAAPAPRQVVAPVVADGVQQGTEDRVTFLSRQIQDLEHAKRETPPGQLAPLLKQEAIFHEEILRLESQVNSDLEDPAQLLEALLDELEKCPHLLTDEQARRLVTLATTTARMHDWRVGYLE